MRFFFIYLLFQFSNSTFVLQDHTNPKYPQPHERQLNDNITFTPLNDTTAQPFRLGYHLNTAYLPNLNTTYQDQIHTYLTTLIMPTVINLWGRLIKTVPIEEVVMVNGNESCYLNFEQPLYLFENIDMLIFIDLFNEVRGSILASARDCLMSTLNNQPVVGSIRINIYNLQMKNILLQDNINLLSHELLHNLGFSLQQMKKYVNPLTAEPIPQSEVFEKKSNRYYLVANKTLAYAREFFDCPELEGIPLEDNGGAGSRGNHFERSLFFDEVMTPNEPWFQPRISVFSLKVLEDSGWFLPDYSLVSELSIGYHQGCDYLEQPVNRKFQDLCEERIYGCGMYRTGVAKCRIDHFLGSHWWPELQRACWHSDKMSRLRNRLWGEESTFHSKCFQAKIGRKGHMSSSYPHCYKTRCEGEQVIVEIEGREFQCAQGDIDIQTDSFEGVLECPQEVEEICDQKFYQNYCEGNCQNGGFCLKYDTCICAVEEGEGCKVFDYNIQNIQGSVLIKMWMIFLCIYNLL